MKKGIKRFTKNEQHLAHYHILANQQLLSNIYYLLSNL
jgi:hypothetical protein